MIERLGRIAVLSLCASVAAAQTNEHKVQEDQSGFEYCVYYLDEFRDNDFVKVLNKFGKEGWAVASTAAALTVAAPNIGTGTIRPRSYMFVMKRQGGSTQQSCEKIESNLSGPAHKP